MLLGSSPAVDVITRIGLCHIDVALRIGGDSIEERSQS